MGSATIKSGAINLLNTILGAGILAMPYGLKSNGLLFGSLLVCWLAATSIFGLYLQNKVAKYTSQQGAVSYFSLAQITYPHFSIVFDSAIVIKCFGVGVSYLVVIGDLMPKIIQALGVGVSAQSWLLERNVWITAFMVLVAPLSYLKKLDSLKYTSFLALFSIVYLMCLVVVHFFQRHELMPNPVIDIVGPVLVANTLRSFPVFVFAYTCHQNMFAIINELSPSSSSGLQTRQANHIILYSICTAAVCYLIVGISGYLTFGNAVNGNIITMYPTDLTALLVGRLCIVLMVALLFPLQCHPCRGSANHVWFFVTHGVGNFPARHTSTRHGYSALQSDIESISLIATDSIQDESFVLTTPMEGAHDTAGHSPVVIPLSSRRFYIITTIIVLALYIVAVSVKSLEHVLAFVGSTGSTSISFILPGLFGFLLIKPMGDASELTSLERACKFGGLALAIWGFMVMGVCLFATIFLGATH